LNLGLRTWISWKKDQPIATPSEKFSVINYGLVAYYKTARWMQLLEKRMGTEVFDKAMQEYFRQWKFRHPYPADLKAVMEEVSGQSLNDVFNLLDKKGELERPSHRQLKITFIGRLKNTDRYNYISLFPVPGRNYYDGLMIGLGVHNYNLPANKFQFILVPLYATRSNQLNGIGRMEYS